MLLTTPDAIRTLQRKLYTKAKQDPAYRFYALYDKVWREDILMFAYRLVRANKGSPGVDGTTFEDIEQKIGIDTFLSELAQDLKDKTYCPSPVRRVMIPKADGSQRPLGIPTIRDRVAQMAVKLVIEPIFEADFCPSSYGFRPKKSAHDAVDEIAESLHQGYTKVIDADLSKYFDSIPHAKLLAVVAERVVDSAILHVIKLWLKAPVIGEDEDGTRKNVGGGKANSRGTPQGGVISPLLSNCYLHLLDRIWEKHQLRWKLKARIVRYADDFVVLCAGKVDAPMKFQQGARQGKDACRRPLAHAPDEASQDQRSGNGAKAVPTSEALCELRAIQGSENGGMENSACLGVKNIGKPCALIAHARFDEGGQVKACSLLYRIKFAPATPMTCRIT